MTIHGHQEEFHGLPVCEFPKLSGGPVDRSALPAADAAAWRIDVGAYDPEEPWEDMFARFLDAVDPSGVRALVVGSWGESYENYATGVLAAIAGARDRLTSLRAVFVGDIVMEEAEISWIYQGRVTDLLVAFPELEELWVRGGTALEFEEVKHAGLRKLVVETGGMPASAVRGVAGGEFPALAYLELWLGTPDYGGDASVDDLAPILSGERLPSLTHLGLCNSEIQDEVCAAVASAPVVARLEALDLSMGILTDDGAAALLSGQPLTHLRELDLSHNYLSDAMRTRLTETLAPADVVLHLDPDDAEEEEEADGTMWRYVAVGE
ncbi:STM4015 family protein [Streptomyces sedi]|uniref:Leucine-rich repeat domain-containing protein n=1 Tax=Streptomyces sedi TaxID=555059 RepID=A0A5C4V2X6_9ACTN|nr:STM4015 family protein [Streptomyces sedi]TNM29419.1 leucine-rich repeat domain-containing protein [Streptomyces sedi]